MVEQQPRGLGAHLVLDAQARGGRPVGDPDVAQPEPLLELLLELVDPAPGVVDPDLDDALALRLRQHPRHVGAAGAERLGDLGLRAALEVVQARGRQQRLRGPRRGHMHLCD
jgi:hypothetical protein